MGCCLINLGLGAGFYWCDYAWPWFNFDLLYFKPVAPLCYLWDSMGLWAGPHYSHL